MDNSFIKENEEEMEETPLEKFEDIQRPSWGFWK